MQLCVVIRRHPVSLGSAKVSIVLDCAENAQRIYGNDINLWCGLHRAAVFAVSKHHTVIKCTVCTNTHSCNQSWICVPCLCFITTNVSVTLNDRHATCERFGQAAKLVYYDYYHCTGRTAVGCNCDALPTCTTAAHQQRILYTSTRI